MVRVSRSFFSGRTFEPLYYISENGGGSQDSFDGEGLGDIDGDGLGEWVMGRPAVPSHIVGRRGNDLFLSNFQPTEFAGTNLDLKVREGIPGSIVAVALVEFNERSFYEWLAFSNLDSRGGFDLPLFIPPEARFYRAVFQAYSVDASGKLIDSGSRAVSLQLSADDGSTIARLRIDSCISTLIP